MLKFSFPNKNDWVASLVVFIVALPLSLGIAMASGAPPAAGLVAAIIGGVIVGALSGAPLAVSGPAAGLSALVFQIVLEHGFMGLTIVTVFCGIIQISMSLFRLGFLFEKVPDVILHGMLAAIGLIIFAGQLHVMMGFSSPTSFFNSLMQLPQAVGDVFKNDQGFGIAPALILGLLALVIQIVWPKIAGNMKWLPGALPAVIIATLASTLMAASIPLVKIPDITTYAGSHFQNLIDVFFSSQLEFFALTALGLAFVASAESLLTAKAVDQLSQAQTKCKLDRELMAQGSGNMVSGLLGGLPMTAVIVRSAANLNAGAKTRWSAILHGVWVLAFLIIAPGLLTKIPLSVLASVLVLTGYKLLGIDRLIQLSRSKPTEAVFWVITVLAIVSTDLLKGLVISMLLYAAHFFAMKYKNRETKALEWNVEAKAQVAERKGEQRVGA